MAEQQNQAADAAAPAVAVPDVHEDAAPQQTATEEAPAAESAASAAAEDKPADEAQDKPAETTEEAEGAKEEPKPIDEGHLSHKAQGAGFPKNLISSKTFFFFGSDPIGNEVLATYKRAEKHAETAYHNIAWAAHNANGLLFIGDKKAPTGVINLSDATEPEVDGAKGFHFTAKGSKHTFKAFSAEERDGWVAKLKEKIAEAKEIATTVTESEAYKQTIESFKPAAPAKEDKPEEAGEEGAAKGEEASKAGEAPKEEAAAAGEETKAADDSKDKRRSASRKRASFFGFGKKEEKEEAKPEEPALSEAPVIEAAGESEATAAEEAPAAEGAAPSSTAAEDKPAEEPSTAASPESPKEKATKRNSIFGAVFSKKEKKVAEPAKTEESPKEEAETTDTAPVIPPVEATTPLAVDVASPVASPSEPVESPGAGAEAKKDTKEKRKSSLPFAFGKRDKSPAPAAEGDEKSKSTFSKLRATIKGKGASKTEEKPAEEAAKEEEEPAKEGEAEAAKEGEQQEEAAEGAATEETPKADETESSKEGGASSAPAVTAAA